MIPLNEQISPLGSEGANNLILCSSTLIIAQVFSSVLYTTLTESAKLHPIKLKLVFSIGSSQYLADWSSSMLSEGVKTSSNLVHDL